MTVEQFNSLPIDKRKELLTQCCGSSVWVNKMAPCPVEDLVNVVQHAEEKWYQCAEQDWLEAFNHHPKIGDISSLKTNFAGTAQLAAQEQSGVNTATHKILEDLAEANTKYEEKFGFIFIVCATGKSADEMLAILKKRLLNAPENEIKIAAEEQNKITQLRLQKLFI